MSAIGDFNAALQSGESNTVEFLSSAIMPRFVQTICALANTEGGVIYVGVADTPDEPGNQPVERSVTGVDPATLQRIIRNLEEHFDDPLPTVREEQIAHQGPQGPVVAVHVERHSGSDQIALADLTIWERQDGQNVSFMARTRRIRPLSEDVENQLELKQNAEVEVVRGGSTSTDSSEEGDTSPDDASSQPEGSEPVARLGTRSVIRREASPSEVALNANGYADVIAKLLASADDGERVSLAIFGHWGRGKTFLAKRVAEHLEKVTGDQPKYRTVLFSAWKYRTTPEVWAYLFERFLQEGKKESPLLPLRASFVRYGPWPLISAMFGLFLALWTVGERAQLLTAVIQAVGAGTIVYGVFLYVRFRSVAVRLRSLYSFASHTDKLGLQAAIGDDLRALLKAWCRRDLKNAWVDCRGWWTTVRESPKQLWDHAKKAWELTKEKVLPWLWPCLSYVAAALLISWKLWPVKEGADWTFPLIGEMSTGVNPYVAFLLYAIWCVLWVATPYVLFFFPRRSTERVLLIVDDLDRCEPKQMLEIIESTMLILDDQDVHQRLQVCMLIDESAFNHALIAKYDQLLDEEHFSEEHRYTVDRIVRENLEKFFLVHLRLSALTDEEIADVIERYVQQLQGTGESESSAQQATTDGEAAESPDTVQSEPDADSEQNEAEVTPDSDSVIEPHEADAILEFVRHHLRGDDRQVVGPRTLRCLLFRYQLARDILSKLGEHPDPRELANVIVAVYANATESGSEPSRVETVVRQVS